MRHLSSCVLTGVGIALLVASGGASAGDEGQGLAIKHEQAPWPRWQGRISVSSNSSSFWRTPGFDQDTNRPVSLSLMGDYYFTRSLPGLGNQGGFRATSGLIVGPRSQAWSGQPGFGAATAFSLGNRLMLGAAPSSRDPSTESTTTLPYLGVGYTGLSTRSGWGFSADLGLLAQYPSNAVRFGRSFGSGQSLDDTIRDLRMTPMFQLGVSYSF